MFLKLPFSLLRSFGHSLFCARNPAGTYRHERKELYTIIEKRREWSNRRISNKNDGKSNVGKINIQRQLPTRNELLQSLQSDQFDVLVVGGGAIGCGCALEAASRGLKTALIETGDYGSGASCKTNKLLEGTNSYLRAAVQGADLEQMFMLQQMMNERATLMRIAPHLTRVQPMMIPIYKPLQLPFYWLGLKLYDAMAGMANVRGSHYLSKDDTLNEIPLLRQEGLLGSLVYYDGKLDDARMCLALAVTALKHGATATNYVQLKGMSAKGTAENGFREVLVEDKINMQKFTIHSKCVINATGHSTDIIRKLDNCEAKEIMLPATSTNITLPSYIGSTQYGLLFPRKQQQQENSEALIMLPYENHVILGSIDAEHEESAMNLVTPALSCEAVDRLLMETTGILDTCVRLRSNHVLSAWTGVKNKVMCPKTIREDGSGSAIISNYLLEVSDNGLITLAGGRWSIYRAMAADAIDTAVQEFNMKPSIKESCTQNLLLDGAENYYCLLPVDLVQRYDLHMDIAQHLSESYGSNALQLLESSKPATRQRLHPKFPYIMAEVEYACQREYACNLVDVIARRLRGAFMNAVATQEMLHAVLEIMAREKSWTKEEHNEQYRKAIQFLKNEMGLGIVVQIDQDILQTINEQETDKFDVRLSASPVNLQKKKRKRNYSPPATQILSNADSETATEGIDANEPSKPTRGTIYCVTDKDVFEKSPEKPPSRIGFKPNQKKPKRDKKPAKTVRPTVVTERSPGACKLFQIKAKQHATDDVVIDKCEPSLGHMIVKDHESIEGGTSVHNMPGFGVSTPKLDIERSVENRAAWPTYKLTMQDQLNYRMSAICSRSQALSRQLSRSNFSETNNIRECSQKRFLPGGKLWRGIQSGTMPLHSSFLPTRSVSTSARHTRKLQMDSSMLALPTGTEATSLANDLSALGVSKVSIYAVCCEDGNELSITKGYIELTINKESLEKIVKEVEGLYRLEATALPALSVDKPTIGKIKIKEDVQKKEYIPIFEPQ